MGKVGQVAIHLLEGSPKGLRIVEYGNWAGRGLIAPRAEVEKLLARQEMALGGLYFLKRPATATRGAEVLFGMATELRPAVQAMAADPLLDDVTEVLVFVRRWGWTEPMELAYLAQAFLDIAQDHPRLAPHGVVQRPGRPAHAMRMALESDLDQLMILLAICGFEWEMAATEAVSEFEIGDLDTEQTKESPLQTLPVPPMHTPPASPRGRPRKEAPKTAAKEIKEQVSLFQDRNEIQKDQEDIIDPLGLAIEEAAPNGKYHLADKRYPATMDIVEGKYVVRKGSYAKKNDQPSMADNYRKLRKRLIEDGVLLDAGEDLFVFTEDCAFDSPSTSASVVRGAQTAGTRFWYDENNVSLRGIQEDNHSLHETHRKPKEENEA